MAGDVERAQWTIEAPPGGWGPPWPQAVELVDVLPGDCWTLVGGLMVQLHAVRAGLPASRVTVDVDIVLHVETGATTFPAAQAALRSLGYELRIPSGRNTPVHRFERGIDVIDVIDVMVADNLAPRHRPTVRGRTVFGIPAGTSALRKTVDCAIEVDGTVIMLSVPDVLGALVLKGAAYKEDPRDRERHLDDAAVLACALRSPEIAAGRMEGSDRGRIRVLADALRDPTHRSWTFVPADARLPAIDALIELASDPRAPSQRRRLGRQRGGSPTR